MEQLNQGNITDEVMKGNQELKEAGMDLVLDVVALPNSIKIYVNERNNPISKEFLEVANKQQALGAIAMFMAIYVRYWKEEK